MAKEIKGVSNSGTLYARIVNSAGNWYRTDTSNFEAYNAANYSLYAITMTEEGNSSVYVADFPTEITASGTYEFFVHRGNTPTEGDRVVTTGKIDWTGTQAVTAAAGSQTGSDWRDYVLRLGFKRTDKDTELFEATTDAIQEMRRRFMFDEAEKDVTTTDTITVLGDFKLAVESDLGLLLDIVLEDGDIGTPLVKRSKSKFNELYPSINIDTDRGYPQDFAIFGGNIYIGPIPDQLSYSYRINYSARAGTILSSTSAVPFTNVYRSILADNVQARLYRGLGEFVLADQHQGQFEKGMREATRRERINSGDSGFVMRYSDC